DEERRATDSQVEIAGDGEVGGEFGILEMAHAGRTNAGASQFIVEPGGGAAAKIRSDSPMNGRQNLQQHEHYSYQSQRGLQVAASLYCADEPAHGNRESCREQSTNNEENPPANSQAAGGFRKHPCKLQAFARAQPLTHRRHSESAK